MAQRGFFIACVLAVVSEALASSLPGVPGTVPAPPVARAWPLANAFSGWVWEQVVPGKNPPLWGYIAFQEPESSCLRLLKVLGLKFCLALLCGFLESSCALRVGVSRKECVSRLSVSGHLCPRVLTWRVVNGTRTLWVSTCMSVCMSVQAGDWPWVLFLWLALEAGLSGSAGLIDQGFSSPTLSEVMRVLLHWLFM